eukprot:TRINITY_DN4046_c0_g2_i1.p1 TRINITY_DN4046_c0_g2~~TRINITY_DN4046_c0_g2_i1.p1  ORF type:complete len:384 (-),score=80.56 TRINITY_DN4046_c0_g2_i1:82-1233(-)
MEVADMLKQVASHLTDLEVAFGTALQEASIEQQQQQLQLQQQLLQVNGASALPLAQHALLAEDLLVRAVKIESKALHGVQPGENRAKLKLNITVTNNSPVLLTQLSLCTALLTVSPGTDSGGGVSETPSNMDTLSSTTSIHTPSGTNVPKKDEAEHLTEFNIHSVVITEIPPQKEFTCLVALADFPFLKHKFLAKLEFRSPLSDKILIARHPFIIRLIDQCSLSSCVKEKWEHLSRSLEPSTMQPVVLDAAKLRKLFSVPPTDALSEGSGLLMEREDWGGYLSVVGATLDGTKVSVSPRQRGTRNMLALVLDELFEASGGGGVSGVSGVSGGVWGCCCCCCCCVDNSNKDASKQCLGESDAVLLIELAVQPLAARCHKHAAWC